MVTVEVVMALTDDEKITVGNEHARNRELIDITVKKVHTLIQMDNNEDRQTFFYYTCVDLKFVEKQRLNLFSKYRNLALELNTCRDELLERKQAKITILTFQHANTGFLKENQSLMKELSDVKSINKTWFNGLDKVS